MEATTIDRRDQYLRGIASSAPERNVNVGAATFSILEQAFEAVQNQQDWKNPINALITVNAKDKIGLGVYLDAIEYFTGTKPSVYLNASNADNTESTFRIVSEGYRLGSAGDN